MKKGLIDSINKRLDGDASQEAQKAAAPQIQDKKKLTDNYKRQTYWLRNDLISFIEDYSYTERITIREAINRLLDIGSQEIRNQYDSQGKQLMHKEEKEF